ncbi:MAG: nitrite/sulfite reductase [Piscirickettsiaceae bacterium]|nr:nitrite/sulfite reductase [Piscirickettsiaceae bacterium]
MYQYDSYDKDLVNQRVEQFADQLKRRLNGELSEEEFLPLRLQNGIYLQKHAYMLRVAIPYGTLSPTQLMTLADIADEFDRGYGHFTTRQNIQFNWIDLERTPQILQRLAEVEMHSIQTSGNCIRNVTTEAFAGVSADEVVDPRPIAEILRQWSTINPEFLFLPRKFKIAVSSTTEDRAAVRSHDLGIYLDKNPTTGELVANIMVGGGLGRTPIISKILKKNLPWKHLLPYLEAVLRVYNRHGRRDNRYKARIKILVKELGIDSFAKEIDNEWQLLKNGSSELTKTEYNRIAQHFTANKLEDTDTHHFEQHLAENKEFFRWVSTNTHQHKNKHYLSVIISTKQGASNPPGDMSSTDMRYIAQLANDNNFAEIRVTHEQNLVLPEVKKSILFELWQQLNSQRLATPTVGLLSDMITCPGGDYCALANAKSIPIAAAIQQQFSDLDYLHDIGTLSLNISGCMNACAHHHIASIGILGVDKKGMEWYQVTIGGRQGKQAKIGKSIGRAFEAELIPNVIDKLIQVYLVNRNEQETFSDTVDRLGLQPFKDKVYNHKKDAL